MSFEDWAISRVPVLARTAVALCGDLGLAEDLVQEVLIKVHARWDRIEGLESRDSYVRRMLVNEFVSWRRKWGRIVPVAAVADEGLTDNTSGRADQQLLRSEIGRLPRARQVVLALRYYGGLTDAEIADALQCSEGTVRSHAARALAALRINPTLRAEYHAARLPLEGEHAR